MDRIVPELPSEPCQGPRPTFLRTQVAPRTNDKIPKPSPLAISKSQAPFVEKRPRVKLLMAFCIAAIELTWNVASPVRNYVLGRYEIGNSEYAVSRGLEWWDELDYKYVHFLYQHAGINTSEVAGPEVSDEQSRISRRVINVYTNLMVLPLATRWAAGINPWHQDPLIGRYCQSGLRDKRQRQWQELEPLFATGEPYRLVKNEGTTRIISNFLPDQATKCRLSEVPEAILCLKGYNSTDLMNLEWSTGSDPNDPVVHEALAGWQTVLLPDLNDCLTRRQHLVNAHRGDIASALNQLADEMARNYSLSPYGWGGKRNLVAVYNELEGYRDVSGQPAGKRTVSITGSINERNRNSYDGDIHAVTAIREAIWTCVLDDRNVTLYQCFTSNTALTVSALFLGDQMNRTKSELLGVRYIQDSTLVQGGQHGAMRRWDYLPVQEPPTPARYLAPGSNMNSGLESAYRDQVDLSLIFELAQRSPRPNITIPSLVFSKCFYEPGCSHLCMNNPDRDLPYYMVYVAKRSGICYKRRMDPELINRFGFVHRDCYGIGTGNHTLYFKMNQPNGALYNWPGVPESFEVPNVADPNAILACIMGGRVPQVNANPFPLEFHDLVLLGTGMVQNQVFRDGSERTLLNMVTLVSLLASVVYALLILYEARFLYKLHQHVSKHFDAHTSRQVLASILQLTLSYRVWRQNYVLLLILGFFSVLSWTIGVHGTMCTWYIDGQPLLQLDPNALDQSVVPEFTCSAGQFLGHLNSPLALMRLVATSFVVQLILLGRRKFLGFTTHSISYFWVGLVLGLVPSITTPFLVVGLNKLRLQHDGLARIHNQLVVAVLWMVLLLAWHEASYYFRDFVYAAMKWFGLRRIGVPTNRAYAHLVSHEYLFRGTDETCERLQQWIPLSVLLESVSQRELVALNFQQHHFEKTDSSRRLRDLQWLVPPVQPEQPHHQNNHKDKTGPPLQPQALGTVAVPRWVDNAYEFYVLLDENA